ncbi:hypothetical protein IW140_005626 [Coemansia sp. RSA 1813]|nr:hypothetical protein EV178_003898 [Coemansia sp. RSA 1646]KAJ1770444.1 hypothetical protein LPJ74_003179 [Coemansia sp. RSA 1843]KAJ2086510.1 hypothetical protein IW138_005630 [Coemansia sp. RSA 986]KAJ2212573.1 hypothetical protein EV179_004555 [Coemansia sp. RSA 487]KAJ2564711.1 hypothetical protein IW140_005626 [Coemansia sp. RSA 1813]
MLFKFSAITAALVASASAHMTMTDPCPRFSPSCVTEPPALPAGASWDYDIKSPIPSDGILCKSNTPWPAPVATWTAGQPVTVHFLNNGAAHGGGHAQFSVSYDGGKTFAVVYEVLRYFFFNGPTDSNTPEVLDYTFTLPKELPNSDSAIFAWSWVNAIGNREFYMNCADVAITGSSSSSYTGKQMVIADHDGYPTIPEFAGNYDTGINYYEDSPMITVSADGSSSYSGGNSTSPEPSAASSADSTSTMIASTEPTSEAPPVGHGAQDDSSSAQDDVPVSSAPAPEPTTDGGSGSDDGSGSGSGSDGSSSSCTHGTLACSEDGAGYQACVWGTWSAVINCPTKTACKPLNNSIVCDWA